MRENNTCSVAVVEADADEEAAVAGEVELHDAASACNMRRQIRWPQLLRAAHEMPHL
jgi:hypothetical protein